MKIFYFSILALLTACCTSSNPTDLNTPEAFLYEQIPNDQLAHGGAFSPDGQQFYLTLSDKSFQNFDVVVFNQNEGKWEDPQPAFFNTSYEEHGVCFSTDGKTLYFSSTRPTGIEGISETWHIWCAKKIDNQWTEPEFVNLPAMENKLVSHPSLTQSNRMYFHAGELDYSDLTLYYADKKNGQWLTPKPIEIESDSAALFITPFIAPDESYLVFGKVDKNKEYLVISYNSNNQWQTPKTLNDSIQMNNRSNPFVNLTDNNLYYAVGAFTPEGVPNNWHIKRMSFKGALKIN